MLPRSSSELKRMLTISKALSAGQAQTYHSREFASEQQNYWSRERQAYSEWRGALAAEWDLRGSVKPDHFARLSDGQLTYGEARREFAQCVATGEFRAVEHGEGRAAPQYTTAEMIRIEREIIERIQSGNRRTYSDPMLITPQMRIRIQDRPPGTDRIAVSRRRLSVSKALQERERRPSWPRFVKVQKQRAIASKGSRPLPARRRNWLRLESRLPPCSGTLRVANSPILTKRDCTCWTSPPLP